MSDKLPTFSPDPLRYPLIEKYGDRYGHALVVSTSFKEDDPLTQRGFLTEAEEEMVRRTKIRPISTIEGPGPIEVPLQPLPNMWNRHRRRRQIEGVERRLASGVELVLATSDFTVIQAPGIWRLLWVYAKHRLKALFRRKK